MRRTELLTLVIILTIFVIFTCYLIHIRNVKRRQNARVDEQDYCKPTTCDDEEEITCLSRWFATFDNMFSSNMETTGNNFRSIAVQPDGKVITGNVFSSALVLPPRIQRFNADGTVDGTFVLPNLSFLDFGEFRMIHIATDGSIFIVGNSSDGIGVLTMVVIKLLSSGNLDTSFGGTGYWQDPLSPHGASEGNCLKLLDNGQILIGGVIRTNGFPNSAGVVRLNADGTIDTTFAVNGYFQLANPLSWYGEIWGVDVQTDGKIVAGGYLADGANNVYGLGAMRLTSSGILDTATYNSPFGFITDANGGFDATAGGAVMINDAMFVAGSINNNVDWQQAVYKFTDQGQLDSTWATAGRFRQEPPRIPTNVAPYTQANGLCTVCDGGIFVGGFTGASWGGGRVGFLYKLTQNGSLDLTFGDGFNDGYSIQDVTTNGRGYQQLVQHRVTQLYAVYQIGSLLGSGVTRILLSN